MPGSDENNGDKNNDEPFNVAEFCKRHLRAGCWAQEKILEYNLKELHELVNQVIEIFKQEPTLAYLSPPCTIVGDIHGQYRDLIRILNSRQGLNGKKVDANSAILCKARFMFLGDFVDRGIQSMECISLVFALKVLFPKHYILLRGNHETRTINFAYGFREELVTRMGQKDGLEIWEHFNEAFSWMPIAGLVGGKILCMHGGISPWLNSLDDIRNIPRPLVDVTENKLALDLLWSDPMDQGNINAVNEKPQFLKNPIRGLSCTFNEQAINECVKKLNIQMIVRAHQVQDNGFKFSADRKLITIFSAPRYMQENDNKGSILKVNESGAISIITLKAKPADKVANKEDIESNKKTSDSSTEDDTKKKKEPKSSKTQSITKSTSTTL
ncbi:unnamed protein product [Caenorhabditis angaria]|uniref:Serine/threonine-protein phosphatase n=1 Tax=Caenorhabditis angaria TaxID=860376 RepID=A0A9P1IIW3_9PELO|nr:unnamed protein product [Caenorhabditis angaria]